MTRWLGLALLLVGLVLLGLVAWTLWQRLRRPPYSTAISDATIDDAWLRWMEGAGLSEAEHVLRDELFRLLDAQTMTAVRADLLAMEATTFAAEFPLTAVRKEMMASVDRRVLNTEILRLPEALKQRLRAQSADVLQNDNAAALYVAANELRLAVLRDYAALRYGDKSPGDWFVVYERASRLKQRSARAFIERSLAGAPDAPADPRHQAITLVDHELRDRLLRVPPGTRFPGLDGQPVSDPPAGD